MAKKDNGVFVRITNKDIWETLQSIKAQLEQICALQKEQQIYLTEAQKEILKLQKWKDQVQKFGLSAIGTIVLAIILAKINGWF